MRKQGLTLIELIIIVAIVAIIAAIALPNLRRNKINSNEDTAVLLLKSISAAQEVFAKNHGGTFAASFDELSNGQPPDMQLRRFNVPQRGYVFTLTAMPEGYTVTAVPQSIGRTGFRHYFMDSSGIVRENMSSPATASSAPIGYHKP